MGFEDNFSKLVDCKIVVNIKRDPIDGKAFLYWFFTILDAKIYLSFLFLIQNIANLHLIGNYL